MGNIITTINTHKNEILSILTSLAITTCIIKSIRLNAAQRAKILQTIYDEQRTIKETRNEVYLTEFDKSLFPKNNQKYPIYKIVVTGGPCGGKSTSFERIRNVFTEKGFRVLCVPEIMTMVVLGGASGLVPRLNENELIRYEGLRMKFQIFAEDFFVSLAKMAHQPAIILCDRGTVDTYAYVSDMYFQAIMDSYGWNWVSLRDKRYDLVCFLSSAANGAEKSEGLELARYLDKRTLEAWIGHPHIAVAPNLPHETFDDKINRVVQSVGNMVGEELHALTNHKILIKPPTFPPEIKYETNNIEEIFLQNKDPNCKENKLKKRGSHNSYTYYQKLTLKTAEDNDLQELRKQLVPKQYMAMKEFLRDPEYEIVERTRIDFVWNNFSYCIDIYDGIEQNESHQDNGKTYLLRFFARKGEAEELIPPFIEVIRNIRGENTYNLAYIAKKANRINKANKDIIFECVEAKADIADKTLS